MPRQSVASLLIHQQEQRPEPLPDLTTEEQQVWRTIVNRMPQEWFPAETHHLLAQYCRHAINARTLSKMHGKTAKERMQIMKAMREETKAMLLLATKMRITQQSSMGQFKSRKLSKKDNVTNLPWQENEED